VSKTTPRVMVVGPFSETAGGVLTFQKNLMQRSDLKERWDFVPFSTSRPAKQTTSDNYSYGALFNSGLKRTAVGLGITAWHLSAFPVALKRHRTDLVQIQSSDFYNFWESMIYIAQASLLKVPTVIRFGGDFEHFFNASGPKAQRLIVELLQTPTAIVVQSQGWKDYFSQHTDAHRLHIVGNAVPHPKSLPIRNNDGVVKILFICTSDATRKGVDAVLAIAPRLRNQAQLVFVAAGGEVQERVVKLGLQDIITHHPVVDRVKMAELYEENDVLLMPSLSEGFPNTMLEGMAAGMAYVGSPVGAVSEVIEEGVNGFLHAPDDIDGLTDSLVALVKNPELRSKMGANNHAKICSEYELNTMFKRFDRIWNDVIMSR